MERMCVFSYFSLPPDLQFACLEIILVGHDAVITSLALELSKYILCKECSYTVLV